jgi:hypothetical protein
VVTWTYEISILNLAGETVAVIHGSSSGEGVVRHLWDASAYPSEVYLVRAKWEAGNRMRSASERPLLVK